MASSGKSVGRRQERLHGAFTGGFSAGFHNSVGSAQGWNPSSFSSSRDRRATIREQCPEDFMDDQDGLLTERLEAKPEFDTLGFTALEVAKRFAEESKGGAIPGPAPSELIMPVGDSMGKKLLKTMGWREGQGVGSRIRRRQRGNVVGPRRDECPSEELSEQARTGLGEKARALVDREGLTFAPDNAAIGAHVMVARSTLHGVGYDPFKNAPEFGLARVALFHPPTTRGVLRTKDLMRKSEEVDGFGTRTRHESSLNASSIARGTHGFALDDEEDDVYEGVDEKEMFHESPSEESGGPEIDNGLARMAREWASDKVDGESRLVGSHRNARCPSDGRLPPAGFVVAQREEGRYEYWSPPKPPEDFDPVHKFEDIESREALKGKVSMDARGRAQLLVEPNHLEVGRELCAGISDPGKDSTSFSKDASVFSLLSSAARQKLVEAKRRLGSPSIGVAPNSKQSSATPSWNCAEAARGRYQEGASTEAVLNILASKFTSETGRAADPLASVDRVARPAGLSMSNPGTHHGEPASPGSATPPVVQQTQEHSRNPSRSTFPWRPAPLLCKRLNVPVPDVLPRADWTPKGISKTGTGDPIAQLPHGMVADSSLFGATKVPLLEGIGERHISRAVKEPGPNLENDGEDGAPMQRPAIDLFKSIFESDSGSESVSGSDSNGTAQDSRYPDSVDPTVNRSESGPSMSEEVANLGAQASLHDSDAAEMEDTTGMRPRGDDFRCKSSGDRISQVESKGVHKRFTYYGASSVNSNLSTTDAGDYQRHVARTGLESDSSEHSGMHKESDAIQGRGSRRLKPKRKKEKISKKLKKHHKRERKK